jgi:hypothetical protein
MRIAQKPVSRTTPNELLRSFSEILSGAARGIQAHEARVVTSAVHGVFRDQPVTRQEFLDLVTAPHTSLL